MGASTDTDPLKKSMDAIAERIKHGIAQIGLQVIGVEDLAVLWNQHEAGSDSEKRLQLENFAHTYGFAVHLNIFSQVAIFRNSNQDG